MKKYHILLSAVICALLLPAPVGAATIMDTPAVVECPGGEAAVAVERPAVNAPGAVSAELEEGLAQLNATDDALHDVAGDHTGWSVVSAAATLNTGKYYLSGDVTGKLTIAAGERVDLCLNGHALDAGGSGSVITVKGGATLRLCDCQGGGRVTGGNGLGGGVWVNGGTLELYGGSITGNQAARTGQGGGVYVMSTGALRMYGGSIDRNQAKQGGGVCVAPGCTFTMTGGEIVNNTATEQGGGVYAPLGDTATPYKLSGTPVIVDNTVNAQASNLCLVGGAYIGVPAALTSDALVGISVDTPGVFAKFRGSLSGSDCRGCFLSDNSDYGVGVDAAGQLLVNVPVSVVYEIPEGVTGTEPASQSCIAGETVTVDTQEVLEKEGYGFVGWTNNRNVKKAMAEVTPMADTTMYPVFYVGFEESGKSTDIDLTYGVDMVDIDLNSFVRSTNESVNASFRFSVKSELPRGLKLVNDAGEEMGLRHILTGRPLGTPGDYQVAFTVNQMGQSAVLFGLEPSPAIQSGVLTLTLHITKPTISEVDFDFAPPAELMENGEVKEAAVTPKRGIAGGVGEITLRYSPASPITVGTYQVYADVAEGSRYQGASGLTDPAWTFTITQAVERVTLGTPQVSGGTTTIPLTVTPADLLDGAEVIAAKYEGGMMTDIAWGRLSGNTLIFSGKQITIGSGWKVFFLSGGTHIPLYNALQVTSGS